MASRSCVMRSVRSDARAALAEPTLTGRVKAIRSDVLYIRTCRSLIRMSDQLLSAREVRPILTVKRFRRPCVRLTQNA